MFTTASSSNWKTRNKTDERMGGLYMVQSSDTETILSVKRWSLVSDASFPQPSTAQSILWLVLVWCSQKADVVCIQCLVQDPPRCITSLYHKCIRSHTPFPLSLSEDVQAKRDTCRKLKVLIVCGEYWQLDSLTLWKHGEKTEWTPETHTSSLWMTSSLHKSIFF